MKPYTVVFSFYEPVEGDITILAESPEEARETVEKLFSKRKDLNIVQVFRSELDLEDQQEFQLTKPEDLN